MCKSVIVNRDGMEWELVDCQIIAEDRVTIRKTYSPKAGLPVSVDIIVPQKQNEANDERGEGAE